MRRRYVEGEKPASLRAYWVAALVIVGGASAWFYMTTYQSDEWVADRLAHERTEAKLVSLRAAGLPLPSRDETDRVEALERARALEEVRSARERREREDQARREVRAVR
jgi:hypothetical protein